MLADYLTTAQTLTERQRQLRAAHPELAIGFAIPYWFDNENDNIPQIAHGDNTKPVGEHLFDILNNTEHGYVVIMDYRTKPDGENGSIAAAENEIRYTEARAPNVKVVIGQLASKAEPASTTFYNQDAEALSASLSALHEAFGTSPNFAGFAIHDYSDFKKLRKRTESAAGSRQFILSTGARNFKIIP